MLLRSMGTPGRVCSVMPTILKNGLDFFTTTGHDKGKSKTPMLQVYSKYKHYALNV